MTTNQQFVCDCGLQYNSAESVILCANNNHAASKGRVDFLSRLREANVQRVARFGHGGLREWSPMQWGCAVAGEVGELCNVLKKFERQMPTDPEPDVLEGMIGQEIADVLIYLDLLAAWYSIDLARVVETKFNATSKRFGFPERL